jgi:hypothetical protein
MRVGEWRQHSPTDQEIQVSEHEFKNFANQILDEYPELRTAMAQSGRIRGVEIPKFFGRSRRPDVYLVNATKCDEEALYVDALAKGAKAVLKNKQEENDIYRKSVPLPTGLAATKQRIILNALRSKSASPF